jgi:shikimate kinase
MLRGLTRLNNPLSPPRRGTYLVQLKNIFNNYYFYPEQNSYVYCFQDEDLKNSPLGARGMRIFLIGFMGSGKTHWGKQVAQRLSLPFYDLDEVIVVEEKRSIPEIFGESGEEYFRSREKEVLEKIVDENTNMVLSCGGGTPCFFNNIEFMKKYGTVVWLNTQVDVLLHRLMKERMQRPLLKDIGDEDLKHYIIRKLNERRMYYEQADVIIAKEDAISMNDFIQTVLHA